MPSRKVVCAVTLVLCATALRAGNGPEFPIGSVIQNFSLPQTDSAGRQTAMVKGKRATVFLGATRVGAGQVTANTIDMRQPPSGGCRTSVALALDNVKDVLNVPGLGHPWCVLGDTQRMYAAYCKLAELRVAVFR